MGLGITLGTWGQGVFYPGLLLLLVGEPAARHPREGSTGDRALMQCSPRLLNYSRAVYYEKPDSGLFRTRLVEHSPASLPSLPIMPSIPESSPRRIGGKRPRRSEQLPVSGRAPQLVKENVKSWKVAWKREPALLVHPQVQSAGPQPLPSRTNQLGCNPRPAILACNSLPRQQKAEMSISGLTLPPYLFRLLPMVLP